MIAGSDSGMPLDLISAYPGFGYWEQKDRADFLPGDDEDPFLEDADEELLADFSTATNGSSLGSALLNKQTQASGIMINSAPSTAPPAQVSWLRRTEYGSSTDKLSSLSSAPSTPRKKQQAGPLSKADRLRAILKTFDDANSPVSEVRHTRDTHKIPDADYPILPNADIWATQYSLVRYPDNPSTVDKQTQSLEDVVHGPGARTETAMLRPLILPDSDHRIGYFLSDNKDKAVAWKDRKQEKGPIDFDQPEKQILDQEDRIHHFSFVRDYESASVRKLRQEFMLLYDEGLDDEDKPRGAYYVPLSRISHYKKKRKVKNMEREHDYGAEAEAAGVTFWHRMAIQLGLDPSHVLEWDQVKDDLAMLEEPALDIV